MGNRIGWVCIVVALAGVLGCGCAVIVNEDSSVQGNVPGASTLSQITPGQTTVEWLLAVAGPPNSRKSVEDGTEIFRYCRTGSSEKEVGIFLLFHLDSSRRRQEAVFVETREGIVQRYWVETDDQ